MPSPDFCAINDNFFNTVQSSVNFQPRVDYVLRVMIDNWEGQTPDASKLLSLAQLIMVLPAVCGESGRYHVKAVLIRQLPSGSQVGYYEPAVLMMGPGCNQKFTASDGAWAIDLVFQPQVGEFSITSVRNWKGYLADRLKGPQGIPFVYVGGLIPLLKGASSAPGYAEAGEFWSNVEPYYEIARGQKDKASGLYLIEGGGPRQINKQAPFTAWNEFPDYLGQDGLGMATGDAFDPENIVPLALKGTTLPAAPPVVLPDTPPAPPPATPPTWLPDIIPAGGSTWATLSTTQKAIAIAGGVVLGWAFGRYVLRW